MMTTTTRLSLPDERSYRRASLQRTCSNPAIAIRIRPSIRCSCSRFDVRPETIHIVRMPSSPHPPSTFSYHVYSVCLPKIVPLFAFLLLNSLVWQKLLWGTLCILFESVGVHEVSLSCVHYSKHLPLAISLQHECPSEDIPYWHEQV